MKGLLDSETLVYIHQLIQHETAYGTSNLTSLQTIIVKFTLLCNTRLEAFYTIIYIFCAFLTVHYCTDLFQLPT